jgi:hypothetical protein
MAGPDPATVSTTNGFRIDRLDLSKLVGFQVRVFSKQFPGRELHARIVAVTARRLISETGPRNDAVENLVNHQTVVLQFPYRGEEISVRARFLKSGAGHCAFDLENRATPLAQRRFHRLCTTYGVNLAPFPAAGLVNRKLERLRWMGTTAINFSAGGALLTVPTILHSTVRLLLNIQQSSFRFPPLVFARVCHCYQYDEFNCRAGIEFITREQADRMFSPSQRSGMPPVLFSYTSARREALNRAIREWDSTINRRDNTGVDNEDRQEDPAR